MQKMRLLILLIMLMICSIDDLNSKKVNILVAAGFGFIAFLLGDLKLIDIDFKLFLDIIPGALFFALSKIRLGIGEADGIIFMILGICLGHNVIVEIMILSFILSFLFSIFLLIKHKKNKGYTFAFVPFILISFCIINMKNMYKTGSLTIELSMIMPGIMAMLILIIFTAYYMHDKCVIKRAAYIACLREAEKDKEEYYENSVYESFEGLVDGKLLGKWQLNKSVEINTQKIAMNIDGYMSSPAGLLDHYLKKPVFFVSMDTFSYLKPDFCE